MDAEEATALAPALERLEKSRAAALAEKEQFASELAELKRILAAERELRAHRSALADDYRRITGESLAGAGGSGAAAAAAL